MNKNFLIIFLLFTTGIFAKSIENFDISLEDPLSEKFSLTISRETLQDIASRIWSNECGKTKDEKLKNIIHWNKNEDHMSLGIMHFTWYKHNVPNDQFPLLRKYIEKESGKKLPRKLRKFCPWKNREDFLQNQNSKLAKDLKAYLLETVMLQAKFLIIERFKNCLKKMYAMFNDEIAFKNVRNQFYGILNLKNGLFIILDTLNMSGEKGLYNTLIQMQGENSDEQTLQDFKKARISRFDYLVSTNPSNKIFYNGWLNRINGYFN